MIASLSKDLGTPLKWMYSVNLCNGMFVYSSFVFPRALQRTTLRKQYSRSKTDWSTYADQCIRHQVSMRCVHCCVPWCPTPASWNQLPCPTSRTTACPGNLRRNAKSRGLFWRWIRREPSPNGLELKVRVWVCKLNSQDDSIKIPQRLCTWCLLCSCFHCIDLS